MSKQPEVRMGYRAALASGELRALVAGQLVSVAGTSVAAVALTILVYRRTASPLLASLAFALGFVPYLLGGGLLSGIVDRVRPRRLVASCDLLAAVLAAAMAWPRLPVGVLFALLLAIGTLTSLEGGARATLVRASVPADAYVPARSLLRISAQLAQIGGNAAGGALLLVLTPSGTLLANGASFALSAATHASASPTIPTPASDQRHRCSTTRCAALAESSPSPSCDGCSCSAGSRRCSRSPPRRSRRPTSRGGMARQPWSAGGSSRSRLE
jgi:hypothetical protein